MFSKGNHVMPEGRCLLRAAAVWIIGALLLTVLATFIANAAGLGEGSLGYISSAVSFLAAAAAGFASVYENQTGRLVSALITATVLVILLLTTGFLIKGGELDPSSIMSLVSFTYAGTLLGAVIKPAKTSSKRHFGR